MTCNHCVKKNPPNNSNYVIAIRNKEGIYENKKLTTIQSDVNGADLAIAKVDLVQKLRLVLSEKFTPWGTDVWTMGYPFTDSWQEDGVRKFKLNGRYLQGYITRDFYYDHPSEGRRASFELSIPVPGGLSGAPVVKLGTREVIGVIYGENDVGTIERFSHKDPQTGKDIPDLERLVSFGLACHTTIMNNAAFDLTDRLPIEQYIKLLEKRKNKLE